MNIRVSTIRSKQCACFRRDGNTVSAFTLVELLVVIGIIALLISILLPAMGKAREQSRTVACSSNMHQLAIACLNYTNDNHNLIIPANWVQSAANPLPYSQSLFVDEMWCNILVNGGYIQAPDGTSGWTQNNGPQMRSSFFCPSGNNEFINTQEFNAFNYPSSRVDDAGAQCVRYYSISTKTAVDCWYGINADNQPTDLTTGTPCHQFGNPDPWPSMANMSVIRKPSSMVFLFDGLYYNHNVVNCNRLNARHGNKTKTNIAYFDGHVDTFDTATLPGGLRNGTAFDFDLSNLLAKFPPPQPLWLVEQQD